MAIADTFRLVWTPFLKQQGPRRLQAVGLVCPTVLGSGGEFTLQVGTRKFTARTIDLLRYPAGTHNQDVPVTYLWMVPRPPRPTSCRAVWRTPLGATYRASLQLLPAEPTQIHVIFKTHLDLGYTHRFEEVVRLYQTRFMESLLENLDKTADRPPGRRFVWTLSTWLLEQCLDPARVQPDHLRRLERHIRAGSVAWGLMPFTTHSEFFGLEEMNRSLYAARRLAERFGRPVPTAAKMTDVPAHTMSLAMAFAAAGGTFFQIGTNPDSRPPAVPPMFWWKLPDGNRLLVHYRGTYGTPLLPPEDWPWREWLAIQITNDNVGPQNLEAVDHIAWIADHFDSPVCRTGRLEDFAEAFIRRHGGALPVVDKEVTDWWIHGIASQAAPTALARRGKDRVPNAEALASLAKWHASSPDADGAITLASRRAFEQLTLYTEHTWGDHASDARKIVPRGSLYTGPLPGTAGPPADGSPSDPHRPAEANPAGAHRESDPPASIVERWTASWADKARFAKTAAELADQLESKATSAMTASLVRDGRERRPSPSGEGRSIILYNTLSWPRSGVVRVAAAQLPAGGFELVDASTGGVVSYEREADAITFLAPPVPACGYLALAVRPAEHASRPGAQADWEHAKLTLHTADYSLQFHTRGGMCRWHDRRRSIQWSSTEADCPTGAYLYEMPGDDRIRKFARKVHSNTWPNTTGYFHRPEYDDLPAFGPLPGGPATVAPEITPLYARIHVAGQIPVRRPPGRRSGDAQAYHLTYSLFRNRPELYVNLRLTGKRATYAAEAGYACFPFAVNQPYVLVDRIAHLTTPADDLAKGVNAAHMAVHHGIRLEGDHAGMNFFPLDAPLVSFGRPGLYAWDENGQYANATLYATLFNNGWGTNFAQWQSGDLSFDFVLHPTGNDGWDGGLSKHGLEYFRPLLAVVAAGRPGEPARSLLQVDPAAVQLVALKPAEFERGTVLRLWNTLLDPCEARILLPEARRGDVLWSCDLLERRRRRVPIGPNGEARFKLKAHEIATLLLSPAGR